MDILQPIIDSLGIDWKIFLFQLINFGIVFFVLKKFAFLPLQKMLLKREQKIKQGLENADKAKTNLDMAQMKYDQEIQKARLKANEIIAEAEQQKKSIIAQANKVSQADADKILTKAHKKIEQDRQQMLDEVKREAVDLSMLATEKLLQNKLTDKDNRQFIEEIINAKN
jgi:F-type H+-transporting ATPase subunit b